MPICSVNRTPDPTPLSACKAPARGLACAAIALFLAALGGCGGGSGGNAADQESVAVLITEVSDGARTAQTFEPMFSQGALPPEADRTKYSKFSFRAAGDPTINGAQATVNVVVTDVATDQSKGEVTWTAVKADGKWKLKSAPLP